VVTPRTSPYDHRVLEVTPDERDGPHKLLTPREAEVLELAALGQTNLQVAAGLGVSVHAVKFHLASIFRKLGVKNRTEAAAVYFRDL
jgi:DNA-binding CsgD family transcriptional regulator